MIKGDAIETFNEKEKESMGWCFIVLDTMDNQLLFKPKILRIAVQHISTTDPDVFQTLLFELFLALCLKRALAQSFCTDISDVKAHAWICNR